MPLTPNTDLLRLDGRSAIVTGAAMGIGRAIAERLAMAGAGLLVADRDESALHAAASEISGIGPCRPLVADVASEDDARRIVEECRQEFGGPDVLVNNAGIFPMRTVEAMSAEHLDRVLAVNLRGVVLLTHHAAQAMIGSGRDGRILNVTSIDALAPTMVGLAAYDASKHGVWGFTKSAALELAPHGIRVNALAPGGVLTPGAEETMAQLAGPDGGSSGAMEAFLAKLPLGRMAEPDEIARVALAIVSDVGSYMVGEQVVVDGGALLA